MLRILYFSLFAIIIACSQETHHYQFPEVDCSPEPLPEYDGRKVTMLDENRNPVKDTIVDQIEKTRNVFKPCRAMTYIATFKDKDGTLITESHIKMMALGKRWEMQPEIQDEIIVQYEVSDEDFERTKKYQINKTLQREHWMPEGTEGVIENVKEVWMHPFRFNQFNFTEVAPFPEIQFPLEVGKKWTGGLRIIDGWGDWNDSRGNFEYEVVARESIKTNYGEVKDAWKIKSKSSYTFGESFFDYWFHEQLGFIKMDYTNYGGQTLVIELESVTEK